LTGLSSGLQASVDVQVVAESGSAAGSVTATATSAGSGLAGTGSPVRWFAVFAVLLTVVGAVQWLLARRRHQH
jgi:hypothetical protein